VWYFAHQVHSWVSNVRTRITSAVYCDVLCSEICGERWPFVLFIFIELLTITAYNIFTPYLLMEAIRLV
jgi:hypothetical protein